MDLLQFFRQAIEGSASDLHLVAGSLPVLRRDGELVRLSNAVVDPHELEDAVFSLISENTKKRFLRKRELDFAAEFYGSRFRVNLHFQSGQIGLAARLIPKNIPKPEDIDFNDTIYSLTHLKDGLVIVTGPSGSGKSTTLAVMINIINKERRAHIITIEDPVEFVFTDEQSIIEQREVDSDTTNFATGLKYALRQDPNVIMVGEIRDRETARAALAAAETGHLVLTTLHTPAAPDTIPRLVDLFEAHEHSQISNQLSINLRAVIAQQILPRKGGGLVAAREILINTRAVSTLIKRNQIEQIYTSIQTSQKEGMITMNKAIDQLFDKDLISETVARNRKRDLETLAAYY